MPIRQSIAVVLVLILPGQAWPQVYTGNERGQNGIFSGFLRMGTTTDTTSGNIRWTGTDFEGYNGSGWSSFTAGGAGWTDSGALVRTTTLTDQIGIGTSDPMAIYASAALFAGVEPKVEFVTGTGTGAYEEFISIRHPDIANTTDWRRLGLLFKFDFEGASGNWKGAGIVVDTNEVWANNPKLHLITDNYKRLSVDIDGNVGVGSTNPDDRFQVWETSFSVSDVYGVAIGEDPGAGNFDAGGHGDLSLYGPGTSGAGAAIYFGDNYSTDPTNLAIGESGGTDTDKLNIHSKEGLDITIGNTATWEAGTPVVVVTNAGKVGVGNTSPTHRLHVSESGAESILSVHRMDAGTTGVLRDNSSLEFRGTDSAGTSTAIGLIRSVHLDPATGVNRSALGFHTRNLAVYNEKMRIDYTGNVGIGNTNPLVTLDVTGPVEHTSKPVIRFTRTGVASNGTTGAKDGQCTSEFGARYRAAQAMDLGYGMGAFGGDASSKYYFTVVGFSNRVYFDTVGQVLDLGTTGTEPVACINLGAPIIFSRATGAYNATNGTKDGVCSGELGAHYSAATLLDTASWYTGNGISVNAAFEFNTAADTANSFYFSPNAYVVATTGATNPIACIHD